MRPTLKPFIALAALLCFGGLSERADAVAITGGINFGGMASVNNTLGTATAFTGFSGVTVASGSDDYAGLAGTAVTYYAGGFSFNPLLPNPVSPLWTFMVGPNTYSFDLESVTIQMQNANLLMLSGAGTAKITGYDDTDGMWNFVATSFGSTTFGFSAASSASGEETGGSNSVPEGGSSFMLLGFSLLGMVSLRRRLKA